MIGSFATDLVQARKDGRIGFLAPDPIIALETYTAVGNGVAASWTVQFVGQSVYVIEYTEAPDSSEPSDSQAEQRLRTKLISELFPHTWFDEKKTVQGRKALKSYTGREPNAAVDAFGLMALARRKSPAAKAFDREIPPSKVVII